MADVYALVAGLRQSADPADRIVAAIWDDVMDRRGWRQEHDGFDSEIKVEIVETWREKVRGILGEPANG